MWIYTKSKDITIFFEIYHRSNREKMSIYLLLYVKIILNK